MPARRRTLPLRHLLILLTAIGLLPLALLGIWSIHVAGEYRLREQERAMLDLARALSSAVDAELDSSVAALSSIARSPAMMAGDLRGFYEVARVQAQAQPEWLGVFLADGDGKTLFRTTVPFGAPRTRTHRPGQSAAGPQPAPSRGRRHRARPERTHRRTRAHPRHR